MDMKKVLFTILGFLLIFSVLSFEVKADSLVDEEDPTLHEGLGKNEEVIDFTSVSSFDLESKNIVSVKSPLIPTDSNNEITPYRVMPKYTIASKQYNGLVYDGWKYAGVSTKSGGTLSDTISRARTNSYSGTLTVTLAALSASAGFDVTYSYNKISGYSTLPYPNGNYRLEYRNVYKKYTIKQNETWAGKHIGYDYVYPKTWVEVQYRVVKF